MIFAVLALAMLYSETRVDDHPLAARRSVPLCELLGEEVWHQLAYPATETVIRVPSGQTGVDSVCALELDPVAPGDRWGRVARGESADDVVRIASVSVVTQTDLRHQSPNLTTAYYYETFDKELVASGWEPVSVQGPWTSGKAYSLRENDVSMLVEDRGIVIWITARDTDISDLVAFSSVVAERLSRQE